ncbi:hypothetical protein EG328_002208 [Venturia inaequalis]|uniref:Glucosamine-6-phosphate isomerase n=1 Tax=Venturia inaequalis TaxID=5025 RepID=A0A8H3ZBR9_VENIN|nr:hypothetical protein EG328_002208 [Venturia inaequalis]
MAWRIIIRDDPAAASKYVADYIVARIKAYNPTPEKPFVLGLPTGSSPEIIYKNLVQTYKNGQISFKNVVTFNMDEYVGLSSSHPQSYHAFMYHHFFSHIDIKPTNVHILNGTAPDLEAECLAYEEKITRAGGIELFLSGIGPDGHIAFNEPGSSLASRTRVKTLAYDTITANSRFFNGDIDAVPKMALTVGIRTILDAREVLSIVTGPHKSLALQKCVEEGVSHMWTLSSLQLHAHALIVCDEAATQDLKVKTVMYFKQIEAVVASSRGAYTQDLPTRESVVKKQDSVKEKLDSPVDSVFGNDFEEGAVVGMDGTQEVQKLNVQDVPIVRSPTPELRPDPMSSRMEKKNAFEEALAGLEPAEIGFESMGARIVAN